MHLWAKAVAEGMQGPWTLALYDAAGKRATTTLDKLSANGQWREFTVPLKSLQADDGFDFGAVRAVQVEADLPKAARLWLDDVYFRHGDEHLGVSDKTITQYLAETAATRPLRAVEALATKGGAEMTKFVCDLWRGDRLEETNREIIQWATGEKGGYWGLFTGSTVHWLYFGFSSQGRLKPGRLTPECEQRLLDFYWEHTNLKNDIASARRSTWYVAGSENHDINAKHENLLSSQIFLHEPAYAQRVYPDLGRMIGYQYDMNDEFLGKAGQAVPKLGSGNFKDGKKYTAQDHYEAWVKFWKEFFAERARHGFFIEHNATGYMAHTGRFLHDIYAWCEDEELRRQARMFLDLAWMQWAQDQLLTLCGGAATRGNVGPGRMGPMAQSFMGGPLNMMYAFSDYEWPRQVWELVLDRQGKGEFAYVSRKPNEEQDEWPRPEGNEFSMVVRPDSRLARYSWVTPDYVLGLRMDHPAAMYCHLFGSGQGIIFPTSPEGVIQVGGGGPYQAVQDRNVALVQPKKSWLVRHPEWFPGYVIEHTPLGVVFGKDVDRIEEQDGWVFAQEGNAYVAFRVVWPAVDFAARGGAGTPVEADGFGRLPLAKDTYTWADQKAAKRMISGRTMTANEPQAALIIEASRRAHHATFEAFQQDVLDNPIVLRQVIGGFLLTYKGCGPDARELYLNCANPEFPKIDGKYINYECPTFDSPSLKGATGSGLVTLIGPISGKQLVLDFNNIRRRRK